MPNPFNFLRMQQLYGMAAPPSDNQDSMNQVMANMPPNSVMADPSTPQVNPALQAPGIQAPQYENAISDMLKKHLSDYPEREQPSMLRRIGGVIAGLGTSTPQGISNGQPIGFQAHPEAQMKVQDEFINGPFYNKMNDWNNKSKPLQAAANEEEKSNYNKRIQYEQDQTAQTRRDALAEKTDKDHVDAARKAEDVAIRQGKLAILQAHENNKKVEIKGNKLLAIDRLGNAEEVKDSDGNAIDIGKMSDEAKLQIKEFYTQADIASRGREQRSNTALAGDKRIENTEVVGKNQLKNTELAGEYRLDNTSLAGDNRLENTDRVNKGRLENTGLVNSGRIDNTKVVNQGRLDNTTLVTKSAAEREKMRQDAINGRSGGKNGAGTDTATTVETTLPAEPGWFNSESPWLGGHPARTTKTVTTNKSVTPHDPYASATPQKAVPQQKATGPKMLDNNALPPPEKRNKGDQTTFKNGKVGTWNGTNWDVP